MSKYLVEKLLESRIQDGKLEFRVKWEGFPLSDCTWEPLKHVANLKSDIE